MAYQLTALKAYKRCTCRADKVIFGVIAVKYILAVFGVGELSCHFHECFPCPLALFIKLPRVVKTCFFYNALSVPEVACRSKAHDRAVILSAPVELVDSVLIVSPVICCKVDYTIERLEKVLVYAVGVVAYFKGEAVGRIIRLYQLCKTCVFVCICCNLYIYKYVCIVNRLIALRLVCRCAVELLEYLYCGRCFLNVPPGHPLDLCVNLDVLIVLSCRYVAYSALYAFILRHLLLCLACC